MSGPPPTRRPAYRPFPNRLVPLERLEGGPLSSGDVARIGQDIAAGLAVAHEAGIAHRDIKPENVMVTTHGEVKILDFGLAKQIAAGDGPVLSSVSASDVIVGTVSAMSPEQALGKPIDGRSDLFSLGALLFELASHSRRRPLLSI